jgi:hypothetical protein
MDNLWEQMLLVEAKKQNSEQMSDPKKQQNHLATVF